jgi:hypothetical protein
MVVTKVAESKGFDFPARLMRADLRAPFPRRPGSTASPNWAATLHGDVAWWTAVVGLPVVFGALAVYSSSNGWAGQRSFHKSIPAAAVEIASQRGDLVTKEEA